MTDVLRPMLELAVLLPGLLLSYLPMKHHLRVRPGRLAAFLVPLGAILCAAGGVSCCYLKTGTGWMMTGLVLLFGLIYVHTLDVSRLKSVNVLLGVCAVFSCLNSIARAINAMLVTVEGDVWFSPVGCLVYFLLCALFVAATWRPAVRGGTELLDEEVTAQTWYFFWILPVVFLGLNLFMIPIDPSILYQGRIMQGYIVISLILLGVLCLFYSLFYLMARSLSKNDRLRQENQFLSMQQAQYGSLLSAVEETRQARHDLRHHFRALSGLAEREEWAEVTEYLRQAQESIPDRELMLCQNPAIDGVAGHYAALYRKHQIPCTIEIDLPPELPVADMDVCLVLSNLLENALEASLRTEIARWRIQVKAYLHTNHILLLTVENTFDGTAKEAGGIFQSSKRKGSGVGIQSVRRIAEKNGGYCRFTYADGIFTANVMLRGSR